MKNKNQIIKELKEQIALLQAKLAALLPLQQGGKSPLIFREIREMEYVPEIGKVAPHNLYGLTLAFVIDYDTDRLLVGWSLCHDENFNRAFGREQAIACLDTPRHMIIEEYNPEMSLVEHVAMHIGAGSTLFYPMAMQLRKFLSKT